MEHTTARRAVEFESEGVTLRGVLHPAAEHPDGPAVVLAHGWTATVAMGLEWYAAAFAEVGVTALAYDHPNLGTSDGEPRGLIDPWSQARGQRDAVRFAADHLVSGPVALWGDSGAGADAMVVAAVEPQVRAVVALNPTLGAEPPGPPPEGYLADLLAMVSSSAVDPAPDDVVGPLPMVAVDPSAACASPSPQALKWFIEHGGAPGAGWVNELTYADPGGRMPYEPYWCLEHIDVPVMITASPADEVSAADAEVSRAALEQVPAPTHLQLLDAGHFGALWRDSAAFEDAVAEQADFLRRSLVLH